MKSQHSMYASDRNELSVLGRFSTSHLCLEPFPHIYIERALPDEVANELLREYPSGDAMGVNHLLNNARWSYSASESLQNFEIPEIWRRLVSYHTSARFWKQLTEAFGDSIDDCLRGVEPGIRNPRIALVTTRGTSNDATADIIMDAQISGNTAVTRKTSVRGTHIDAGNKLISGLFYLRHPKDDTEGGDLEIQSWRRPIPRSLKPHLYYEGMRDVVKTTSVIPYRHNSLILFINSIDALHAVTPRHVTSYSRLFLNLTVETNSQRYEVPEINLLGRVRRKMQRTLTRDEVSE